MQIHTSPESPFSNHSNHSSVLKILICNQKKVFPQAHKWSIEIIKASNLMHHHKSAPQEILYNSSMEVDILQWASGYNFRIRNKKLLELTLFFFLVCTITSRYTHFTSIFHFLPEWCKNELTSLSNTTI